jgi:hypothetical protein
MITSFDTSPTAKRLREAGFEGQAEALTAVLRDVQEAKQGRLATKADIGMLDVKIDRVAAEFDVKIERLEAKIDRVAGELRAEFALIRAEMEVLRRDLTIRPGSMIVVAAGVLLAAKFFG